MQTVNVTLRSDLLEAVINYALEQVENSGGEINPFAWGDNENAIGCLDAEKDVEQACAEMKLTLEAMWRAVNAARGQSQLMLLPLPTNFRSVIAFSNE